MAFRLADLAARVGAELVGDPDLQISRARSLSKAGPGDIAFLTQASHLPEARSSRASAIVVPEGTEGIETPRLVCGDAAGAMLRLLEILHPAIRPELAGRPPHCGRRGRARRSPTASVGPYVVIGDGTSIGEETRIDSHVSIGRNCRIGRGCWIQPHATIYDGTIIGDEVDLQAGSVVGAAGHGFLRRDGGYRRVPQVGIVELGKTGVEIGANSSIDRATLDATIVGAGTKIDNLVQVGHNVEIGEDGMLCGQAGLAGSSRIGRGVVVGGKAGISDHLEVGDGVQLGAAAILLQSTPDGGVLGGNPAMDYSKWRRQTVLLRRIEEIYRRILSIEHTM